MPRYEQLDESRLDDAQRRIWDACKAGPRGSVPPPVHVWLKSPGLADHAHQLGAHVRFGTGFLAEADRDRDPDDGALLDRAVRMGGACAALAQNAGISQDVIDAIGERKTPASTIPTSSSSTISAATITRTTGSTIRPMTASSSGGARRGIVDLAGLIGYYSFCLRSR